MKGDGGWIEGLWSSWMVWKGPKRLCVTSSRFPINSASKQVVLGKPIGCNRNLQDDPIGIT